MSATLLYVVIPKRVKFKLQDLVGNVKKEWSYTSSPPYVSSWHAQELPFYRIFLKELFYNLQFLF
jgi:hypothetical protein